MPRIEITGSLAIFAVTVATSLVGLYKVPAVIERSLFRPYWWLRKRQYETLITSGFVHADLGHLIFNMLTFYFFAFPLERVVGTTRFLLLYATGLLVSHAGTWLKQKDNPRYACLGASGAIAAVLFAAIVYFPAQSIFIIPIPVPIPAPLFALGYVAYSWYSARYATGPINHDAHLGGALSGLAFVLVTDPAAYSRLLRMLAA